MGGGAGQEGARPLPSAPLTARLLVVRPTPSKNNRPPPPPPQAAIDAVDGWNLDRQLDQAMDALRCPPGEALVANLSGGERRRVALCRLLLAAPDILLLDEPTNHLDALSVAWLERYLADFKGTVVAVTHDRCVGAAAGSRGEGCRAVPSVLPLAAPCSRLSLLPPLLSSGSLSHETPRNHH